GRYTFDTVFHPRVVGQVSCVISVHETDNANGGVKKRTVTLTGHREEPPINADVSPTSVAFGDVRRNTDSTQAQIKLSSTGSMPLSVSSVTITPGLLIKAGPTGAFTLPANASQVYPIVCHPTALGGMTG